MILGEILRFENSSSEVPAQIHPYASSPFFLTLKVASCNTFVPYLVRTQLFWLHRRLHAMSCLKLPPPKRRTPLTPMPAVVFLEEAPFPD